MQEYYFKNNDFIPFESDIVQSGCLGCIQQHRVYSDSDLVHIVYPTLQNSLEDKVYKNEVNTGDTLMQIDAISERVENFMLSAKRLVYHPSKIECADGAIRMQYLPAKQHQLYQREDLERFLKMTGKNWNKPSKTEITPQTENALYFPSELRYNRLELEQSTIGRSSRCNIIADFDGRALISRTGELTVQRGYVLINGSKFTADNPEPIQLVKGDTIDFGFSGAIFW